MYYVGIDYHKSVAVACIIDGKGKELETIELPSTPEGMDMLIGKMGKKKFKYSERRSRIRSISTTTSSAKEYPASWCVRPT